MEFKEIIKKVRKEIREAYKGHKVSVRERQGGYSYAMTIDIEGVDRDQLDKARTIIKKYQDAGDTDIMRDYFDYNFYYTLNGTI